MTDFRKKIIEPSALADVLFSEFIMNEDQHSLLKLDANWELSPAFEDKVLLYKLATVLLVLLILEDTNLTLKNVRENFEELAFSAEVVKRLPSFLEVKKAMNKLLELFKLLDNPDQWTVWAIAWLNDIGIEEANPARLIKLASMWIDDYVTISEYLEVQFPSEIESSTPQTE